MSFMTWHFQLLGFARQAGPPWQRAYMQVHLERIICGPCGKNQTLEKAASLITKLFRRPRLRWSAISCAKTATTAPITLKEIINSSNRLWHGTNPAKRHTGETDPLTTPRFSPFSILTLRTRVIFLTPIGTTKICCFQTIRPLIFPRIFRKTA